MQAFEARRRKSIVELEGTGQVDSVKERSVQRKDDVQWEVSNENKNTVIHEYNAAVVSPQILEVAEGVVFMLGVLELDLGEPSHRGWGTNMGLCVGLKNGAAQWRGFYGVVVRLLNMAGDSEIADGDECEWTIACRAHRRPAKNDRPRTTEMLGSRPLNPLNSPSVRSCLWAGSERTSGLERPALSAFNTAPLLCSHMCVGPFVRSCL